MRVDLKRHLHRRVPQDLLYHLHVLPIGLQESRKDTPEGVPANVLGDLRPRRRRAADIKPDNEFSSACHNPEADKRVRAATCRSRWSDTNLTYLSVWDILEQVIIGSGFRYLACTGPFASIKIRSAAGIAHFGAIYNDCVVVKAGAVGGVVIVQSRLAAFPCLPWVRSRS